MLTQRLLNRERERSGERGGQGRVVTSAAGTGQALLPKVPRPAVGSAKRGKDKTPETLALDGARWHF